MYTRMPLYGVIMPQYFTDGLDRESSPTQPRFRRLWHVYVGYGIGRGLPTAWSSLRLYHSTILNWFHELHVHQDSDLQWYLICVSSMHYVMRSTCLPSRETCACQNRSWKLEQLLCSMFSRSRLFIQCAILTPLLILMLEIVQNYIVSK